MNLSSFRIVDFQITKRKRSIARLIQVSMFLEGGGAEAGGWLAVIHCSTLIGIRRKILFRSLEVIHW